MREAKMDIGTKKCPDSPFARLLVLLCLMMIGRSSAYFMDGLPAYINSGGFERPEWRVGLYDDNFFDVNGGLQFFGCGQIGVAPGVRFGLKSESRFYEIGAALHILPASSELDFVLLPEFGFTDSLLPITLRLSVPEATIKRGEVGRIQGAFWIWPQATLLWRFPPRHSGFNYWIGGLVNLVGFGPQGGAELNAGPVLLRGQLEIDLPWKLVPSEIYSISLGISAAWPSLNR